MRAARCNGGSDRRVALEVERDRADRLPVASVAARPPLRVPLARLPIQRMARRQNLMVTPGVSLGQRYIANAVVSMLMFVRIQKARCPGTCRTQDCEAIACRKLELILGSTKQARHENFDQHDFTLNLFVILNFRRF